MSALCALPVLQACDDEPSSHIAQSASAEPAEAPSTVRDVSPQPVEAESSISVRPPDINGLPIEFDPPMINLGILRPEESGTGAVMIRNTSDKPLAIKGTRASCACTYTRDLSGVVIPPGESVQLEGSMTPKPGLGIKTEAIRVAFKEHSAFATVYVRAEVALPIRTVPPHIESFRLGRTGTIQVESLNGKPFEIIRADGKQPDYVGFIPFVDEPRHEYTLRWDLTDYDAQTMPWWWVIETTHPEARIVDVRIRDNWTRNTEKSPQWVLKDSRIIAGVQKGGMPFEVKAVLQYNPKVTPPSQPPAIELRSDEASATLLSWRIEKSDVICEIQIEPLHAAPGLFYEKLQLTHAGYASNLTIIATME